MKAKFSVAKFEIRAVWSASGLKISSFSFTFAHIYLWLAFATLWLFGFYREYSLAFAVVEYFITAEKTLCNVDVFIYDLVRVSRVPTYIVSHFDLSYYSLKLVSLLELFE